MKATLWDDLHPNDSTRPGLIILDATSKAGDGNQYISCACGGGDAEELEETARRIVALWNAAGDGMRRIPICPHCGHTEINFVFDKNDCEPVDFKCPQCGKAFVTTPRINIAYIAEVTE